MKDQIAQSLKNIRSNKDDIEGVKKYINAAGPGELRECFILSKDFLNPQSYGDILEKNIIRHLMGNKIIDELSGDIEVNNKNIEVKVSIEGVGPGFNFVQIRPNHDVQYYLFVAYSFSNDELYIILIPSKEMKDLVLKYGGYAHGTIKKNGLITEENYNKNKHYEYAIRPNFRTNNNLWKKLLSFRKKDFSEILSELI